MIAEIGAAITDLADDINAVSGFTIFDFRHRPVVDINEVGEASVDSLASMYLHDADLDFDYDERGVFPQVSAQSYQMVILFNKDLIGTALSSTVNSLMVLIDQSDTGKQYCITLNKLITYKGANPSFHNIKILTFDID